MFAIKRGYTSCIRELLKNKKVELDIGSETPSTEIRSLIEEEKQRREKKKTKKIIDEVLQDDLMDLMDMHKRGCEEIIRREKAENAAKLARLEAENEAKIAALEVDVEELVDAKIKEEETKRKEEVRRAFQESEERVKNVKKECKDLMDEQKIIYE